MLQSMVSNGFKAIAPKFRVSIRSFIISSSHSIQSEKSKGFSVPKDNQEAPFVVPDKVTANFIARTIGSPFWKWNNIMKKHPELKSLTRQNFINTVQALKALKFNTNDILEKPMILYVSSSSIRNRYEVLSESGVQPISIVTLFKYITIMNKSITLLKANQCIPFNVNVVEQLCAHFTDVKLDPKSFDFDENVELKKLREILVNSYLRKRLDLTEAGVEKTWRSYKRVRHRSFHSIQSIINILMDELHFSKERIVKNAFLLYGDAENVRRIITEIPKIGDQDMRDIGYRRPKILMSNCDALLKTINHVKSFGIGEDAITRCLEVLTLGPDTVLERLQELNEIEEFQVLGTNPRILRLVHYQNKARMRLEYLNQLKVRCASLHILSCGSEAFARFARDGTDRTKGRDIIVYLANIMERDEHNVRSLMSRHPNWCHIPVLHVKHCYEFLLKKLFSVDDIYGNMHLLLYPISRIEEKLTELNSLENLGHSDMSNVNVAELSNNEILNLTLYLIECEFHFSGDGVWTDHHTQQVENFSNLLPDFPESVNKVYKYGVKPAGSRNLDTKTVEI